MIQASLFDVAGKVCFRCGINKPISEYYTHKMMSDGHLNKCKACTRNDTASRSKVLSSNPEWVEKEQERHRDKYYRLNYKEKHRPKDWKQHYITTVKKHRELEPEKYKARCASQGLLKIDRNNHLHHWSYNKEHWKDVIELDGAQHAKIHRFIKYDQEYKMYRTKTGELLDTKEKHVEYIKSVA